VLHTFTQTDIILLLQLMGQHFAWYHVKEITNLSDVSTLLMKEYGGNHGDVTPGDEKQQW